MTPSFLDEMLRVIEAAPGYHAGWKVVALDPPTRLSDKFAAVGRAHGLVVRDVGDGTWIIEASSGPT